MKKWVVYTVVIFILVLACASLWFYPKPEQPFTEQKVPTPKAKTFINLEVPYISEAPEGNWSGPWINACEEASIAMVEKYYQGHKTVSAAEATEFMHSLFKAQDALYGSNANTDAERTMQIINKHSTFKATIKENPTIEEIKAEIREGRPVISLHYGFDLKNDNIVFLPAGSSYHALVIKGFDDETMQFITNDDGDRLTGADYRYNYELFMNSIHDYVFATEKANGTPRVLFTSAK